MLFFLAADGDCRVPGLARSKLARSGYEEIQSATFARSIDLEIAARLLCSLYF